MHARKCAFITVPQRGIGKGGSDTNITLSRSKVMFVRIPLCGMVNSRCMSNHNMSKRSNALFPGAEQLSKRHVDSARLRLHTSAAHPVLSDLSARWKAVQWAVSTWDLLTAKRLGQQYRSKLRTGSHTWKTRVDHPWVWPLALHSIQCAPMPHATHR